MFEEAAAGKRVDVVYRAIETFWTRQAQPNRLAIQGAAALLRYGVRLMMQPSACFAAACALASGFC